MAILGSTESIYYPVAIKPDPLTPDQWITEGGVENGVITYDEWAKKIYLEGCGIYELPSDHLTDLEDITGKILSEPDRVFAVVYPWGVQYVGLEIFTEDMLEDGEAVPNQANPA